MPVLNIIILFVPICLQFIDPVIFLCVFINFVDLTIMLLVLINVNYHIINLSSFVCSQGPLLFFVTACHTKCVIVTNFQSFVFVKAWISLMAAYCKCLESDIRNSNQLFSLKFDSLIRKTPFISL